MKETETETLFVCSAEMEKRDKELISKLKSLPLGFWDFVGNDTREYTHGIHSYPAMMVCPISRNIIRIMKSIMPIDSLLDPFSGSGTVLVEGMLAGIQNVSGNDINPLALFLARVKTTLLDISILQQEYILLMERIRKQYHHYATFVNTLDDAIANHYSLDLTSRKGWGDDAPKYLREYCQKNGIEITIPSFKNIGYWFKPRVIVLLQMIKDEINKIRNEDIRNFVFVAFSESIRLVSNRRNGEFKMFRMPASKVASFYPDVIKEFTQILDRNIKKMSAFTEIFQETDQKSNVRIFRNDAVQLEDIQDDFYDLIVTSPPYGDSRTTVAYGEYSRLSLQWLDIDELSEKEIMSIDKRLMGGKKYRDGFEYLLKSETLRISLEKMKGRDIQRASDVYSFYNDLNKSIKSIAQKTKLGGYHFWVVGNRTVKNELLLTDEIITEFAREYGMEYVYTIDRNISNKVMPSKNSPTNEVGKTVTTMTNEHIVVLRKAK